MKIAITFERETGRYATKPELCIWMRFSDCTHDDFHNYLDKNGERLRKMRLNFDVGYMDKVIYFASWA
jgi:hypothetical protein